MAESPSEMTRSGPPEDSVFKVARVPRTPFFTVSKDGVPITAPGPYGEARAYVLRAYKAMGKPAPRMARAPPIKIYGKKLMASSTTPASIAAASAIFGEGAAAGKKRRRAWVAKKMLKSGYDEVSAHAAVAAAWRALRRKTGADGEEKADARDAKSAESETESEAETMVARPEPSTKLATTHTASGKKTSKSTSATQPASSEIAAPHASSKPKAIRKPKAKKSAAAEAEADAEMD